MSSTPSKRTRSERVASLQTRQTGFGRVVAWLRDGKHWPRIGLAAFSAVFILVVCRCWQPPFTYRPGHIPPRDVVARTTFQVFDRAETDLLQRQKRREVLVYYENKPQALTQRREALRNRLFAVGVVTSLDQMDADTRLAWRELYEGDETAGPGQGEAAAFSAVRALITEDPELKEMEAAIQSVLLPYYDIGLLKSLSHQLEEGNQKAIRVFPEGRPKDAQQVEIDRVRIVQVSPQIQERLLTEFKARFSGDWPETAAKLIGEWLVRQLPETLSYSKERSEQARREAAASVDDVMTTYFAGVSKLAIAGRPLGEELTGQQPSLVLLRAEWEAMVAEMTWLDRAVRLLAYLGMIIALYLLGGLYIHFSGDRRVLHDAVRLARLLALIALTVVTCRMMSTSTWRLEIVPIMVAAMTATVVYGRPLALVLIAALCLAVTLLLGQDIAALVALSSAGVSAILLLGRIRDRQRLVYVGCGAGAVAFATVLGVGFVTGQAPGAGQSAAVVVSSYEAVGLYVLLKTLANEAVWYGGGAILGGFLMAGLLPFVEKGFQVQTDLSLLELGDASHPLLRQLAQRAPGTYNHSINVASIAEAAAEGIGANGLLVRVGAYFHDIGKMFKPDYFIENQGQGPNQHMRLQPAMSTLVIIAHVKDGADLARSHKLPEPIVDFILQHHGTTLVEYFYHEAARRSEEDPHGEEVSDKDFRYPGPKPQTLEAAVLMLADGVESASRALVEPTPSRIQSLVDSLAMKKLSDGQFDECGLTLMQLDRVKKSLVKSLTAIYHARVKYPGQQSA